MSQFVLPDPAAVVSSRRDPTMWVYLPSLHTYTTPSSSPPELTPSSSPPELIRLAPILCRAPETKINSSIDSWSSSTHSVVNRQQSFSVTSSTPPTFSQSILERSYANTAPPNHLRMCKHHAQTYPYCYSAKSRTKCLRCLQSSETVWVAPKMNRFGCDNSVLNDIVPKPHTAARTSKGKRGNRKKHSRMNSRRNNMDPNATTKAAKSDDEAGRRYDHAYALSVLQNALLAINPSLAEKAAASFGNTSFGWSPLRENNICWDVKKYESINPLLYNKMDIFGTSKLIVEQFDIMIKGILSELEGFHVKGQVSSDPYFALKSAKLMEHITTARRTLGQGNWLWPTQICANST